MDADGRGTVAFVLLLGMLVSAVVAAAIESKLAQLDHPRRALRPRVVPRSFAGGEYPPECHALQARGRKWFIRAAVFACLFVLSDCIGV